MLLREKIAKIVSNPEAEKVANEMLYRTDKTLREITEIVYSRFFQEKETLENAVDALEENEVISIIDAKWDAVLILRVTVKTLKLGKMYDNIKDSEVVFTEQGIMSELIFHILTE